MTTIGYIRGFKGAYPDVRGLGKEFAPAAKLIQQAAKIRDETHKAGRRARELEQEVQFQEQRHAEERAAALRNGKPEPSVRKIQRAKRAQRKAQQRYEDGKRAAEMVDADIRALLQERGPEYGEIALDWVRSADQERAKIFERLQQVESEAALYRGLYEWATDPNRSRGFAPVPADDMQWRRRMLDRATEQGDPDAQMVTGIVPDYTPAV